LELRVALRTSPLVPSRSPRDGDDRRMIADLRRPVDHVEQEVVASTRP
jgi:hypothetical protein